MTTPFNPEDDYPDPRGYQQRQVDSAGSDAQSAAITDSGMNPHAQINEMIEQIREARLGLADLELEDPPLQFDVLPDPQPPAGQPDLGIRILVVRGELLLRVPAPGTPGAPGEAAGPYGDARTDEAPLPWERAHSQLVERGYEHVGPEIPVAAPLRRYVSAKTPDELLADREVIRTETRAEVDLNYVVTLGHLVKSDDYPRGTAAHRCYSPHWIRCHRVTREITVAVIDTGISADSRTDGWLTGIPETPANIDPLDVFPVTVQNGQVVRGDGLLDLAAGHGSFVTGVVEQVAPAATIRVYRAVDTQGAGSAYGVANAMVQAARDGADILHLSLGLMTVDNEPPVAFITAVDTIRSERSGVVIVASAGNMGLDIPMYPAAMPEVTGVAALNPDVRNPSRAPWSNYGDWVDCSAVGVGITSTFVEGYEPHTENGQLVTEYFGNNSWAYWSGTSFSAPQISGAVAQLCQLNDVDPSVALDQLLNGRITLPGCGYVVPILPGS